MVASRDGTSHIVSDRKTILHADMRGWPYSEVTGNTWLGCNVTLPMVYDILQVSLESCPSGQTYI